MLIDFVYHSTLGLRVMKKKKRERGGKSALARAFLTPRLFTVNRKPQVNPTLRPVDPIRPSVNVT